MTLPAPVQAVAWDVDGTLIDSEPTHLAALLATCAGYEVDLRDLGDGAFVGVSLHGVWQALRERFPPDVDERAFVERVNAHYAERSKAIAADETARETVERLAVMGLAQVAVSNSHRVVVDANLQRLRVTEFLAFSIALDDVRHGKPDPEPYRSAAARLELSPARMVVVEDSASGVHSARAAGCPVIGRATVEGDVTQADVVVSCLAEVPALLEAARRPASATS